MLHLAARDAVRDLRIETRRRADDSDVGIGIQDMVDSTGSYLDRGNGDQISHGH